MAQSLQIMYAHFVGYKESAVENFILLAYSDTGSHFESVCPEQADCSD